MKILIADILLHGKPHSDWKEGYEFKYAFENLGHSCDVYGPYSDLSEELIPQNYNNYDFVLITENYPNSSGWKWWDWSSVKIPKVFWAIDTHLVNYVPFIVNSNINYVGFNNFSDMEKYNINSKKFWLPYGISSKRYTTEKVEKIYNVSFIGSLTEERKHYINKYNINHFLSFGPEYIKKMKQSKICFNKSMSYDLNAKMLEIIGSGSFMLSNYSNEFIKSVDGNEDIKKMMYINEEDFLNKMNYYLENEDEREIIASRAQKFILENHSFESRAKLILKNIF
jgi:spore maturation protein CgeB